MGGEKRLLIVDDDEILLQTFGRMLIETPYAFDTAVSIELANKLIDLNEYDAILLDYLIESNAAMDFVKQGAWNRQRTKMILIVGHVTHAKVRDFFFDGVSGYLLKPFNKEDLIGTLNAHLWPAETIVPSDEIQTDVSDFVQDGETSGGE